MWLARDVKTGRDVALKIVPRQGNAASRAQREAQAASRLRHRGCLRAHALAHDSGHVYIAYEYVPGRTLRQAMRADELDDAAVVEVCAQILEALDHAHSRGIVHRDVKPANVLLCDGPELRIKLLDFGLALLLEEEALTAAGDVPGTLAYMSPERLRGRSAGPAADVWAVGVILWEALAGRHPFWDGTFLDTARRIEQGAPSLRDRRPDLPQALVDCVEQALLLDPARRPSARALAGRLRRAVAARASPRSRQPLRRVSPSRLVAKTAHAAAASLLAGWTAATFPFFPAGWPSGLAAAAGGLALVNERAGLALALAVPILPLGNYSLGLALLYAATAALWLACFWRRPRAALLPVAGPLLAPAQALPLLPLIAQGARTPLRRALATAASVFAAAAVEASGRLDDLGIASSRQPSEALAALAHSLAPRSEVAVEALVLAVAAALLPLARGGRPWPALALAGGTTAALLLAAPKLHALSVVAYTAAFYGLLLLEARLRRGGPGDLPTAETVPLLPVRAAREAAGRG